MKDDNEKTRDSKYLSSDPEWEAYVEWLCNDARELIEMITDPHFEENMATALKYCITPKEKADALAPLILGEASYEEFKRKELETVRNLLLKASGETGASNAPPEERADSNLWF